MGRNHSYRSSPPVRNTQTVPFAKTCMRARCLDAALVAVCALFRQILRLVLDSVRIRGTVQDSPRGAPAHLGQSQARADVRGRDSRECERM